MFNDIYEIRDIGTKTDSFLSVKILSLNRINLYRIIQLNLFPMILATDTISVIKKKIMSFGRKDITHHQMSLWAEFNPESVPFNC